MKEYGRDSIVSRCNKERSLRCRLCSHYQQCVTNHYYCPPYALAILHLEQSPIHPDYITIELYRARKKAFGEYYNNELTELHRRGFKYADFCKTCRFECRFRPGSKKNKHCPMIQYIWEEIPCPNPGAGK